MKIQFDRIDESNAEISGKMHLRFRSFTMCETMDLEAHPLEVTLLSCILN
jgi:hypothetical protein